METDRGLQDTVTRNVRVLMAIHGILKQQDLAARLGWPPARINKTLGGSQLWALADLADLGRVFNVRPADLLSDTTALVGAAGPARAASHGVSRIGVTGWYRRCNGARVIPFPRRTSPSRPRLSHPANGRVTRLNWHNERPGTSVTAQVGT